MLIIRQEQMDVMSACMFDNFISKMVVHLRATYPDKTQDKSDKDMREFVRAGVETANSFNIRTAENLEFFLEYTNEYGSNFYKKPNYAWANAMLADASIDETEKMNRLNEHQIFSQGGNVGEGH